MSSEEHGEAPKPDREPRF